MSEHQSTADSKLQSKLFGTWENTLKEWKKQDRNPESVAKAVRDDAERAASRLCNTDLDL
jgi:hypothetical protein